MAARRRTALMYGRPSAARPSRISASAAIRYVSANRATKKSREPRVSLIEDLNGSSNLFKDGNMLSQDGVGVRRRDIHRGVAEPELGDTLRVLRDIRRIVGIPHARELGVVARVLSTVEKTQQVPGRPETLERTAIRDVTRHPGPYVVLRQEIEVPTVAGAGGQGIGGELDRPDDLLIALVGEIEDILEARQQCVLSRVDHALGVVGRVREVSRLPLRELVGGGIGVAG